MQDDNELDGGRPAIEDRLGRHSDTELDDPLSARSSNSKTEPEVGEDFETTLRYTEEDNDPELTETRERLEVNVCTDIISLVRIWYPTPLLT